MAAAAEPETPAEELKRLFAGEAVPADFPFDGIVAGTESTSPQGLTTMPVYLRGPERDPIPFVLAGECVFGASKSQQGAWQCEVRPRDDAWLEFIRKCGARCRDIVAKNSKHFGKSKATLEDCYVSVVKQDKLKRFPHYIRVKLHARTQILRVATEEEHGVMTNTAVKIAPDDIKSHDELRITGSVSQIWVSGADNGEKLSADTVLVNGNAGGDPSAVLQSLGAQGFHIKLGKRKAPEPAATDGDEAAAEEASEGESAAAAPDSRRPGFAKKARLH